MFYKNITKKESLLTQWHFYEFEYVLGCLKVKVTWHAAKYGDPYSEFVLCI